MRIHSRRNIAILATLLILGTTLYAWAEDKIPRPWRDDDAPVVVELFTSTNCGACLEADRILYDISPEEDVIALGCHVDYWDENTLNDPTGLEACTYRQWAYISSGRMSDTKVFVPYFMINGKYSIDRDAISSFYYRLVDIYRNMTYKPARVGMEWKDQQTISIHMPDANRKMDDDDSFNVWLVRYRDFLIKKIDIGQTAGRVLRFTHVVEKAQHIAKWHGEARTIDVSVPMPPGGAEKGGYAVLIHGINGSELWAAGKLQDYDVDKARAQNAAQAKPAKTETTVQPEPEPEPEQPAKSAPPSQ